MQIYNPTAMAPRRSYTRAEILPDLSGKTIAVIENGKLNASPMLKEIAALFEAHHNCTVLPTLHKSNASAPAPSDTLETAAKADFLITGLGD